MNGSRLEECGLELEHAGDFNFPLAPAVAPAARRHYRATPILVSLTYSMSGVAFGRRVRRSPSYVATWAFPQWRSKSRQRSLLASRQALVFVVVQPHLVPDRYGASRRFETTPSNPIRSAAARSSTPSSKPSERHTLLSPVPMMRTMSKS